MRQFVLVFFDDILIYSPSWQSHVEHLDAVLNILATNSFTVNLKKGQFGKRRVEYLGHIISADGVAMDPSKVAAVLRWPVPKSIKAVRGFLGLTGYYRRFIRNYGKIAQPLTTLFKNKSVSIFCWTREVDASFRELQQALVTAPVLSMPDFSKTFVIECDASGSGLGAVLMQTNQPIAYFSKGLSAQTKSLSTYEKEPMALVLAIQHWRPYLLGQRFVVRTDHRSLRHLLHQKIATPAQQLWVAKLLGYDFVVDYKSGFTNAAADSLSRQNEETP